MSVEQDHNGKAAVSRSPDPLDLCMGHFNRPKELAHTEAPLKSEDLD